MNSRQPPQAADPPADPLADPANTTGACPGEVLRSNCILEAVREYRRLRRAWAAAGRHAGAEPYLWLRASRLAPAAVPHVGVACRGPDGTLAVRSFAPLDKRPLPWWRAWRVVVFEGRWTHGDDPPPA